MEPLLIFPYNGNALEALDCLSGKYEFAGFVDDTPEKQGTDRFGYRVLTREAFREFSDAKVLAVPGSPASYLSRPMVIESLEIPAERFARVVHPTARVSALAKIGHNVLIMAGAVITSNAVIGDHVCILPNTVIHHDVTVRDWSVIGSNVTIAGGTHVGENCYIGSGSRIIHGISIGERAIIGLGTNVIRPVAAHSKMVGNPARQIN